MKKVNKLSKVPITLAITIDGTSEICWASNLENAENIVRALNAMYGNKFNVKNLLATNETIN